MRLFLLPSAFKGGSSDFMADHWANVRKKMMDMAGQMDKMCKNVRKQGFPNRRFR